MNKQEYYPRCPICGQDVSPSDGEIAPWGHIEDDPRPCLAHNRCLAKREKEHKGLQGSQPGTPSTSSSPTADKPPEWPPNS